MGLLDEAIREHLELKRRRGADPSEVARQQREVLAPAGGDDPELEGEEMSGHPEAGHAVSVDAPLGAADEEHPTAAHETLAADGGAPVVQETAEIDMQTVLEDEPAGTVSSSPRAAVEEEDLAWEMPAREASDTFEEDSELPREIPGQERMSFE